MQNFDNHVCVLVNDINLKILNKISGYSTKSTILKEDVSPEASTIRSLFMDNKYYSAEIKLFAFDNTNLLKEWKEKNCQIYILAVFICVEIEQINIELFEIYKNFLEYLCSDIQIKAIVLFDSTKGETIKYNLLQKFCNHESLELVEMSPDEETKQSLEEFQEKYGSERLWEILASVNWPQKVLKKNPILLPENRQRLQEYIMGEEAACSTKNKISISQIEEENQLNIENLKNIDLLSQIGLINKFKSELSNLSQEERVEIAAKIALNILDSKEEENDHTMSSIS